MLPIMVVNLFRGQEGVITGWGVDLLLTSPRDVIGLPKHLEGVSDHHGRMYQTVEFGRGHRHPRREQTRDRCMQKHRIQGTWHLRLSRCQSCNYLSLSGLTNVLRALWKCLGSFIQPGACVQWKICSSVIVDLVWFTNPGLGFKRH